MNNKSALLKSAIMALISVTGLLSSNVTLASPNSNDGYNSSYYAGNNKHRRSVATRYRHNQPRIKHGYTRSVKHSSPPRFSASHSRFYSQAHYNTYPVTNTHASNYSRSVHYRQTKSHNNTGAVIVGGVLGGVIANDISGGDGAVTAFGALTGAVLANGLTH